MRLKNIHRSISILLLVSTVISTSAQAVSEDLDEALEDLPKLFKDSITSFIPGKKTQRELEKVSKEKELLKTEIQSLVKKVGGLNNTVGDLSKQLDGSQKEIFALKQSKASDKEKNKKKKEEYKSQIKKLVEENKRYQSREKEKHIDENQLHLALQAERTENDRLNNDIKRAAEEKQGLLKDREKYEKQIRLLSRQYKKTQNELTEAQKKLADNEHKMQSERGRSKSEINQAKESNDSLSKHISGLEKKLSGFEKKLSDLREKLREKDKKCNSLLVEQGELRKVIATKNSELAQSHKINQAFKKHTEDLEERNTIQASDFEKANLYLKQEISNLTKKISELESENKVIKSNSQQEQEYANHFLETLKELSKHKQEISNYNQTVFDQQSQELEKLAMQNGFLTEEKNQLSQLIKDLSKKNSAMQSDYDLLSKSLIDTQNTKTQLEKQISRFEQEKKIDIEKYNTLQQANIKLSEQCQDSKNEIANTQKKIEKKRIKVDQLKQQLASSEQENNRLLLSGKEMSSLSENEKHTLNNKIIDYQEQIKQGEQKIKTLQTKYKQTKSALANTTQEIAKLKQSSDQKDVAVEGLKGELNRANIRTQQVKNDLAYMQGKFTELQNEYDVLRARSEFSQSQLEGMEGQQTIFSELEPELDSKSVKGVDTDIASEVISGQYSKIEQNIAASSAEQAMQNTVYSGIKNATEELYLNDITARMNMLTSAGDDRQTPCCGTIWAKKIFGSMRQNATDEIFGYKGHVNGLILGADLTSESKDILGVAFGLQNKSTLNLSDHDGVIEANTNIFSIYGQKYLTSNWILSTIISYSKSKIDASYYENDIEHKKLKDVIKGHKVALNLAYDYPWLERGHLRPFIGAVYGNMIGYTNNYDPSDEYKILHAKSKHTSLLMKVGGQFVLPPFLSLCQNFTIEPIFNLSLAKPVKRHKKGSFDNKVMVNAGGDVKLTRDGVSLTAGYNIQAKNRYKAHNGSLKLEVDL